jgi:hypothetical protein
MFNINTTSGIKIFVICLLSITKSFELNSTTLVGTQGGDQTLPPKHGKYFYADFYTGNIVGQHYVTVNIGSQNH